MYDLCKIIDGWFKFGKNKNWTSKSYSIIRELTNLDYRGYGAKVTRKDKKLVKL